MLDKFADSWAVANQKRSNHGNVLALDAVNSSDELLRLRKIDVGGVHFDARRAVCESGMIREAGGAPFIRNVDNIDDVRDFEVIGQDKKCVREWIQLEHY